MKKLFTTALAVFFAAVLTLSGALVNAESEIKVHDDAGLLNEAEYAALEKKLEGIVSEKGYDIVVATADSLGGMSVERKNESLYSLYNVGTDKGGIIYLVAMNDRKYDIYTRGFIGSDIMTQGICDKLGEKCAGSLTSGNYSTAFNLYADSVSKEIDYYNKHGRSSDKIDPLLPAMIVGFIIGLISVLVMKSGMKTTRPEAMANNYIKSGSFRLSRSNDIFLYSRISKTRRSSSSGGSGGSGSHHSSGSF